MPQANKGEVWLIDFGLAAKVRPALIVSVPFGDHERALYAVIPHTTALRDTRFEVPISLAFLDKAGAFDIQQTGPIPAAKLLRKLGALSRIQVNSIERVMFEWFGFSS